MIEKKDLLVMMMALFSAFNREVTGVDVESWHFVLSDIPQDELADAIRHLTFAADKLPSASSVRRLVFDRRRSTGKLRPDSLRQAAFIGSAVKEWRARNPGATADQVAEYVSRLERRLSANVRG